MDREIYDNMREIEQTHWWFVVRRKIIADQISQLLQVNGLRILEVGCGTGGNLEMLSVFGDVIGVEPDEPSRLYASERSGIEILSGYLPDGLPNFDSQFDLVTAFDVIEHVEDDQSSILALKQLISPGGFLIATVPAYPWLWSSHDVHHHHRRRYLRGEFQGYIRAAGFEIRRATYFNTLLFPPIAATRLIRWLTGGASASDDAAPPGKLVNAILTFIFSLEQKIIRHLNFDFGVSIMIVAQKSIH